MATTELKSSIESLNNSEIKPILVQLLTEITKRDGIITNLENRVAQLEDRVNECEKYSSKDTIIFENLPIIKDGKVNLADQVCDFLYSHLSYRSHSSNFKACHYLAPWKHGKFPPPVIVKFIYFGEKMEIFGRKSWLAGIPNPINGKPIVLKERLPAHQKAIKEKAESEGLITSTFNCNVKVFTKTNEGHFRSIPVNSLKAVEDIKNKAVKKQRFSKSSESAIQKTPMMAPKRYDFKSLGKRLLESPSDEESGRILKSFCIAATPETTVDGNPLITDAIN